MTLEGQSISTTILRCHPLPSHASNRRDFTEEGSIQEGPEKDMLVVEVQRFFLLLQLITSL